MKIKPTQDNLVEWIEIYVPEKDLFFLSKDMLSKINLSSVEPYNFIECYKNNL